MQAEELVVYHDGKSKDAFHSDLQLHEKTFSLCNYSVKIRSRIMEGKKDGRFLPTHQIVAH